MRCQQRWQPGVSGGDHARPWPAEVVDLGGRVVNCFMKCEADRRGELRGRRQIMLDDSDVHHHRHAKAAVGAVAAVKLIGIRARVPHLPAIPTGDAIVEENDMITPASA